MSKYRSPSHNRLLALEQELLAKKRWAKELRGGGHKNYVKQQEKTRIVRKKRYINNRLLQLEQDILRQCHNKKFDKKVSQAETLRIKKNKSDRLISSKDKPQQRKSKANRIKSQVFDTGEPIILQYIQYKPEIFTATTPQKVVVPVPEKTSIVEILPTIDLPVSDEKLNVASVDDSPEAASFLETSEVPKIEASKPELPIMPEPVVAESEIPAETERETENSLSQAAELISKIDTQPYPLQAEDIPPIIAELNSDRPEATTKSISPQKKPASDRPGDRKNPHAIFDRLGKNMAYATTFDLGTIELEQLFDQFDDTLDREEKTNQDNAIAQKKSNLELEQRFDEFDRTLDREENTKTDTEQTTQTESIPEILSEQTDIKTEKESHPKPEETEQTTDQLATEKIDSQNQQSLMTPITSHQGKWLQSLSYDPELQPETSPKFDVKLEALLFRMGINFISLILRWLNLLRHKQIDIQPEINPRSPLFSATYSDNTKDEEENSNSLIIDPNQKNSTEENSPLIFSIERSSSSTKSTPVDLLNPVRDSLTGMPNYEFTEQNSYPSIDYPKLTTAENMNNPKLCDPPQETGNDSS